MAVSGALPLVFELGEESHLPSFLLSRLRKVSYLAVSVRLTVKKVRVNECVVHNRYVITKTTQKRLLKRTLHTWSSSFNITQSTETRKRLIGSWLKRERNFAQKRMRTCGACARRFMRHFLARLHFSAEELLLYPRRRCQRPRQASTCKMLGQMLKSGNWSLSVFFFLHFKFAYHTNKAPYNKSLRQARIRWLWYLWFK